MKLNQDVDLIFGRRKWGGFFFFDLWKACSCHALPCLLTQILDYRQHADTRIFFSPLSLWMSRSSETDGTVWGQTADEMEGGWWTHSGLQGPGETHLRWDFPGCQSYVEFHIKEFISNINLNHAAKHNLQKSITLLSSSRKYYIFT